MGTRSSPITVGRDAELARIDEARGQAATGQPALVIVRGEAGIGKTRLIRDVLAGARAAGSPVLAGACLDLAGDGLPYLPFVEALRNFVRATPAAAAIEAFGPAAADLGRLVPEIAALTGDQDRDGARATGAARAAGARATDARGDAEHIVRDSTVERARLFERFLLFIGRLGADLPVVAVIEDVQWADPATHDLVTYLARNVTTERFLLVVTCRTDDLPPGAAVLAWLAELGRTRAALRLELGRLAEVDVARQLAAIHEGPVPEDLARSIWRRSEGHPLFVEELLAAAGEPAGSTLPPSLVDILLTRVASLDPETLAIVRVLAVAGRPADERLLAPLVGRTPTEVGRALRLASARGVLVALPDGRHGFRHELLREVVERDLSLAERRELHDQLARRLEASPELADERPAAATAELARHWAGADRPVEAHAAALAAAGAAEAVHAFADAHRQLERAIALEGRLDPATVPPPAERARTRLRAATVADLGGAHGRAVELLDAALALVDEADDPRLAGLLRSRLAFLMWAGGDGDGALVEHRRAVELVPLEPPTGERAAVLGGLGGALMGLGQWAESRPICEAAIECALSAAARPEESRARTMLGSDLVALGELEDGLDQLRQAYALAGPEPTELWVVTGHNLGLNLLAADHLEEALAVASRTLDGTRAGGLERRYGMELSALVADILIRVGRWDDAAQASLAGLALDQQGRGTPYLGVVRARILARRGAAVEARRRLAEIDRARLEPDLTVFLGIVSSEVSAGRQPSRRRPRYGPRSARGLPRQRRHAVGRAPRLPRTESGRGPRRRSLGPSRRGRPGVTRGARGTPAQRSRSHRPARVDRVGHCVAAVSRGREARLDQRSTIRSLAPRLSPPGMPRSDPAEAAYARSRFAERSCAEAGSRPTWPQSIRAAWRTASVARGGLAHGGDRSACPSRPRRPPGIDRCRTRASLRVAIRRARSGGRWR